MPAWIVHLETATEILKRIKINNENSFLIGNLIPDAERHVVKDFSIYVPYRISHFSEIQKINGQIEELPNIDDFLCYYKNKLTNPMVLGYLTHLLTDYYWNSTTYFRYTIRDKEGNCIGIQLNDGTNMECTIKSRSSIKHNDFSIFENKIIAKGNYRIPNNKGNIMNDLSAIREVAFNEEDISNIINYIKLKSNEEQINGEYRLFTEQQIEKDYKDSIDFVINYLENLNIK